jgi:hypothetical protein
MSPLGYLVIDLVVAIVTAPWLPPLVGVYLVALAGAAWVVREWRDN